MFSAGVRVQEWPRIHPFSKTLRKKFRKSQKKNDKIENLSVKDHLQTSSQISVEEKTQPVKERDSEFVEEVFP